MPKFELRANENLLEKGNASLAKSKVNLIIGKLYVTDQRFVFQANGSTGMAALGALGGILAHLIMGDKVKKQSIDVPISAINGFTQGKHGMNKKVLDIQLPQGEVRFLLNSKYEKWEAALQSAGATAIASNGATDLEATSETGA